MGERRRHQGRQLLPAVGEAGTKTPEGESRPDQNRVAQALRGGHGLEAVKGTGGEAVKGTGGDGDPASGLLTCSTDSAASLGATCSLISSIFSTKIFLSSVISMEATGVPRTLT